jgi:hypothetical protein
MFEYQSEYFRNSTVLIGICILIMNLGGIYIRKELPDYMDDVLNTPLIRRIIVFTVVLVYTKDIETSIIITIIFIIFIKFLLNKDSKFCILSEKHLKQKNISHEEYLQANRTIKQYIARSTLHETDIHQSNISNIQ